MTRLADIVAALNAFPPPDPDWAPASLSVGGAVFEALHHETHDRPSTVWTPPNSLLGLRVDLVDTLPPDVWRIHDASGRVIRDSRSGRRYSP